jgi:thioredoxin-related protein
MKHTVLLAVSALFFASSAFAKSDPVENLPAALAKAKSEKKLLFVEFGREACANCQALKGCIKTHALSLPESQFVYADLDCDNAAIAKPFYKKFKVDGNTLPFVVIADSDGKQLAGMTGFGTAADYQNLVRQAKKKAGAAAHATGADSSFDAAFKKP